MLGSVTRGGSSNDVGQWSLKLLSDWALAWLCATHVVTTCWTDEYWPRHCCGIFDHSTAIFPRQYSMSEAFAASRSPPTCSVLLSRLWKRRSSDQDLVRMLCKCNDSETGVMIPWELPVNVTARLLEDSSTWVNVLVAAACSRELQLVLDIDADVHKTHRCRCVL